MSRKSKEESVISYYVLCNRLKNVIRTGWLNWNVERDRVESIAEHVFGVEMLAIAMKSQYEYDIDIEKVIFMLAIHELGETVIGDITQFDMPKDEKERIEHEAVHEILSEMLDGEEIEKLFLEFDSHLTPEAMFAYECDKLECDLQATLYGQEGCVDLNHQEGNDTVNNSDVKKLLEEGKTFQEMWLEFGQMRYPYDENFLAISNYARSHTLQKDNT